MSVLRGILPFLSALGIAVAVSHSVAPSPARAGKRAAPVADGTAVLAIVRDGPNISENDGFFELVLKYLRDLAGDDYKIKVDNRYTGDHTADGIRRALSSAMADPRVEVVFGGGMIVSELGSRLTAAQRPKPFFAGFPELSERSAAAVSTDGTSAVPNFTFVSTPLRVLNDFAMLRRITDSDTLHGLVPVGLFDLYDDWEKELRTLQQQVGADVVLIPVSGNAAEILAALPRDVTAINVGILPWLDDSGLRTLFAGLEERKVFCITMYGRHAIDLGATAALGADIRDPLARRTAVNLHQLFLGYRTSDLQVYLPSEDQLVINSPVARAIGWSPNYETYLTADFINEVEALPGVPLALDDAMDLAARRNPDARASREAIDIAEADARIARSALLPQLNLSGQHAWTRVDDRIAPTQTAVRQNSGRYGLALNQILFDDEVWSNFRARRFSHDAARFDAFSSELDARANGGTSFLQLLLADILFRIEKENLRLSESNLRLARLRVNIGEADPSEVFRWESQVARGRADLIQREATRENALAELNRIVDAERDARWVPTPIEVRVDDFYFMDRALGRLVQDGDDMNKFKTFVQIMAVENSPELASFDQTLEAQGILLGQKRRRYFLPSISLQTSYDRAVLGNEGIETLDGTRTHLNTDAQDEWGTGIALTFPLFEGGRRQADIDRQEATVRQLQAKRRAATQSLRRSAVVALNTMSADHANIVLSKRALESAQKNFDSVREKYSQGAATILDLLDAQSGRLQQKQQLAAAKHNFLIDAVSLQRSLAWFQATKSDLEKQEWTSTFETFLQSGSADQREVRAK